MHRRQLGTKEVPKGRPMGPTTHQGAPEAPGAPRWVVGDTSILDHAFYIDIYCIMGCYYTLYHNTYGYSLLFYKVYLKGECRQLEFWTGKGANIRDLFCTTPKVLKLHGACFWNI